MPPLVAPRLLSTRAFSRALVACGLGAGIVLGMAACADAGSAPPADGSPPPSPVGPPAAAVPGSSGAMSSGTPAPPGEGAPVIRNGVLLFATGAPIAGVTFASGAQTGTTDAKGTFTYEDGKKVQLSVGAVTLGAPLGAPTLSPYQVAGSATCDDTDEVKKLVGLFESLDVDGDFANGITVPASGQAARPLPAAGAALRDFVTAFDGEAWTAATAATTDTFSYGDAIVRGQGVATDGTSWFFSGTTGLEKTSATFASTKKSAIAIPLLLAAQGSDHIGDIDFWNGTIYAPVEDKTYAAPKVVLYDASSLGAGTVFDIPQSLQTKGVPWIAVDGPRNVAYMAEWDPTPELHVFALATLAYQRAIPLSTPTGRVHRLLPRSSGPRQRRHVIRASCNESHVRDVWIKNKRSKDDMGQVFRSIAQIQACAPRLDAAGQADLAQVMSLYASWSLEVESEG